MNASKYDCKKNLDKLENVIQRIYNKNLQMDYTKIHKMLNTELEIIRIKLEKPTTKNFELYLLNYKIVKNLDNINKL